MPWGRAGLGTLLSSDPESAHGLCVSEYCFTSLSVQEGSPMPVLYLLCLIFRMTSRVLYSTQYHRQHCTLQAFEQFGALYMHNHDDKYTARPGFEPGTYDTNEPSGPAPMAYT